MTAYPVICLVDYEDGYRTVITLEEPSDADTEMGAIARIRITTDDGKTLQVGLSSEAAEVLELRLRELRGDSQGGEGECLDRSDARGVAGDRCESGNECGRLGCPECQS